jgi:hypothetical protein
MMGAVAVLAMAVTAIASHQFSDVPTSASYHGAVEWMVNRGISLGCATGLYCPNDSVTRAQMALFMQRLGIALTPTFLGPVAASGTADLSFDTNRVLCASGTHTPPHPQTAIVYSHAAITTSSGVDWLLAGAVSVDGGTVWSASLASASASEGFSYARTVAHTARVTLSPGVAYRFGALLIRTAGTGNITWHRCMLLVQIENRNAAASPLVQTVAPAGGRGSR